MRRIVISSTALHNNRRSFLFIRRIEPTADPETARLLSRRSADGFILEGSQKEQEMEVDLVGLPSHCLPSSNQVAPRVGFSNLLKFFGLTIRQTTVLMATVTSFITTTSGSKVKRSSFSF